MPTFKKNPNPIRYKKPSGFKMKSPLKFLWGGVSQALSKTGRNVDFKSGVLGAGKKKGWW